MSYGYPGQGYGPPHDAPPQQYGGGGEYNQYPPQSQGYGQYPPRENRYDDHRQQDYRQDDRDEYRGEYRGEYRQDYRQDSYQQDQDYRQQNQQSYQYNQQQQYPPQHHQQSRPRPPPGPPPSHLDSYGYPKYHQREIHAVPTGSQQFGHGAPQEYTFQYSNCSGRRRALLIGINYFGQKGELRGCINDTQNLSAFLVEHYGYRREDMVILTDDRSPSSLAYPSKHNIIQAMQWLVKGAQPNDSLFLHYSGHGGQTEDLDGDEEDGHDEVIYPVDFQEAGHIVDDEIHHYVVKPLQAGVRLTAIFDSCHSGSVMDLPYLYSTKGVLKEPNLAKEAGAGLLQAGLAYARGDMGAVASSFMSFAKSALGNNSDAYEHTIRTKTSPADVVMWSGSKDDQTSADATIASQATGAMSHAFVNALKKNPKQSYVQLLNTIRDFLDEGGYSQKPQLSCSHPLDTEILFVM